MWFRPVRRGMVAIVDSERERVMSYQLAVDLGTTRLTAAVARPGGVVEPAVLGAGPGDVPAVAHLGADGALLVGSAAQRRAATTDLEPGAVLAVVDVGGGTCDAAVVRREPRGTTLLGRPERLERLGGTDIDGAVFDHVRAELGARWAELDPSDAATL